MSDSPPLIRQWILLKRLSAARYGVTVQDLAHELAVNEKTIRRDLNAFRAAGFHVEESVGDYGQKAWRIQVNGKQPDLSFPLDEALALYLGRRFLEPLAGTMLWEATQNAFKKIRACLPPTALAYLEKMAGNLHLTVVGASDYSKKSEIIDNLMRGIEDHHQTMISYHSLRSTEPVTYDVYPYALSYHRNSLYLIAYSPDHKEIRHFKVDRIEEANVTEFPFQRPDDFDPARHLADSFGIFQGSQPVMVRVRFFPPVVRYVSESRWHESQELEKQRDGSLLAQFHLSDTEEIKRWILSFGSEAEVLEPQALRDEIAAELTTLLARYQERTPQPPSRLL